LFSSDKRTPPPNEPRESLELSEKWTKVKSRLRLVFIDGCGTLNLFCVFLVVVFVVVDLEVPELVGVLGRGDDAEPVAEVVLLQVLLREVLKVPLGEGDGRGEDDLVLVPGEAHVAAEVLGLAAHLDPLLEVGLEVGAVHDAVLDGVRAVDGELERGLLAADLGEAALATERLLSGLGGLLGRGLFVAGLLGLGLHLDRHHVEGHNSVWKANKVTKSFMSEQT
jgi:hypothetical protein